MYTYKQIVDNQKMFKNDIIVFLQAENRKIAKDVLEIDSQDEFILKEKEKYINRLKKIKINDEIEKYFFSNPKRDKTYYVWLDVNSQEAIILKYV